MISLPHTFALERPVSGMRADRRRGASVLHAVQGLSASLAAALAVTALAGPFHSPGIMRNTAPTQRHAAVSTALMFPCNRPVVRLTTVLDLLGIDEDAAVCLIDEGSLQFAFNFGARDAARRQICVLTACVKSFIDRAACPMQTLDAAINLIIPIPVGAQPGHYTIPASQLRRRLAVSSETILRLISAGELKVIPGRPSPKSSPLVMYRSAVQFLRSRAL